MIDSGTRKAIIDKLLGKKVNNFVNGRKVKDGNAQDDFIHAGGGGIDNSVNTSGVCHRGNYQSAVLASYCSECGEKLNEGWKYCAGCGKDLQHEDVQPIQEDKGGGMADLLGGVLKNKGAETEEDLENEAARKELREKVIGQGINVNVIKGILR